ncbi:hypothetical protein CASFOL_042342 [Castilleja foliolosa]|uniref:Bifunctional inhibitor/plant lipid transfer protein/seed storage helical domain-containing protein n=1 Tax=Castilleja foliolosa TaxID=1961234 RepID=A0ABD3BAQ3_9LAMI
MYIANMFAKMKRCAIKVIAAWCLVVVLVAEVHHMVAAVDCDVADLAPACSGVIAGAPPSPECCGKLKEKLPCYCDYLKDPTLGPYIGSPIFKQVVTTCHITLPTC